MTGIWNERSQKGHFIWEFRGRHHEMNLSQISVEISGSEISPVTPAGLVFVVLNKIHNPHQFSLSARPAGIKGLTRDERLFFEGMPLEFVEQARDRIISTLKDWESKNKSIAISLKNSELISTWSGQAPFFLELMRYLDLLCDLADLVENWYRGSIPASENSD